MQRQRQQAEMSRRVISAKAIVWRPPRMSPSGQTRRFDDAPITSGLPLSTNIGGTDRHVSKVPTSDIPHAERLNKSRPSAALNSILSIGDQAVIKSRLWLPMMGSARGQCVLKTPASQDLSA